MNVYLPMESLPITTKGCRQVLILLLEETISSTSKIDCHEITEILLNTHDLHKASVLIK